MSHVKHESVVWTGEVLTGCIMLNGVRATITATRDMIHRHVPGFNDAVSWEIEKHRVEIFEQLAPILIEMNGRA